MSGEPNKGEGPKPPARKAHLSIYVAAATRKQLRAMAAEEDRTITEIVEAFIGEGLAKRRKHA